MKLSERERLYEATYLDKMVSIGPYVGRVASVSIDQRLFRDDLPEELREQVIVQLTVNAEYKRFAFTADELLTNITILNGNSSGDCTGDIAAFL